MGNVKNNINQRKRIYLNSVFTMLFFLSYAGVCNIACAEESLCAKVKIEIKQELTLERQAFDAHMRINNGLTHISLENVDIDVWFTNEAGESILASSDPNNTDALFYIRVDSMENIEDVDGAGSVPASTSSDIHWLIIPAPGASNGLEQGTLYNVGATLTYTIGGEENVTEVSPDYIYVKPMPELTLDYFLPSEVYGDDTFTPEIEPAIPFSLGVRVKNSGAGAAKGLKIDSAQPKIVENDQGLLVNFYIEGSEVNGSSAAESLLVDFGNIAPNTSGMARWIMTCTLSGRFIEFEARFSHADELGGELTSLIDTVNTHFLVRDVLVDLPGRDVVKDFLAIDGDIYRVYESDSEDVEVTDQSELSSLQFEGTSGTGSIYKLTVPSTAGFMFVKLSDPTNGEKVLTGAIRSDGKEIKTENAWQSKTQDRDDHSWAYFLNLFDVNAEGSYTLVFEDPAAMPQPPVLQFIPDRARIEGEYLSFLVEASDPNGTIPILSASPLPAGATFTDNEDGTAFFEWTPAVGQKGDYSVTFMASDGALTATRRAQISIYDIGDTDMDGMLDSWEMTHFGTLDRDGTGDFDGDGISDLQEFLDGTDPTTDESAPSIPGPLFPLENEDVMEVSPELVIENSTDADADNIVYEFEIYSDPQMNDLVASQLDVAQGDQLTYLPYYHWLADTSGGIPSPDETTNWPVPAILEDDNRYYWRVRSTDGEGFSLWAYKSFFVNTVNDPPASFQICSPSNEFEVDSLTPLLTVMNSEDVDSTDVVYNFEVYEDEGMVSLVTSVIDLPEGDNGTTAWQASPALQDNTWYYWRAVALDGAGAQTGTQLGSFFINTANHAPESPDIISPSNQSEIDFTNLPLVVSNALDADGDLLTYLYEIDTSATFDSPDKIISEAIDQGDTSTSWQAPDLNENTQYYWRVKAFDGGAESPWSTGCFFVNKINDAPVLPTVKKSRPQCLGRYQNAGVICSPELRPGQ